MKAQNLNVANLIRQPVTAVIRLTFLLIFFSLHACTVEDPLGDKCGSVVCFNGGYCSNGDCVCPAGFTGADCSQQITPSLIRITKIEVIRFPATDNGAGWDLTSGPDLLPDIRLGNTLIWQAPSFIQNADPAVVHTFIPNPIIELSSPNSQYTISLYDFDDFDANDFMGGINFVPYSSSNAFPSELILDAGGSVAFRVYLSYAW
jgi:hypothetical protein